MTAFFTAFLMVFLAELGDKTQLLVMAFAAKYRWQTVMLAVLIATVANHLVAIIIGIYVNTVINMDYIHLAAAATFFIFCIGTLISNDREEKLKDKRMLINPFWTVAVAFFLAETGGQNSISNHCHGCSLRRMASSVNRYDSRHDCRRRTGRTGRHGH